ncbi:MAG: hypothetical protein A2Y09_01260 [Planctomycetes bacterium GWA2_39_15]|nr:MAG: hypothetical protein A2Y09_01260 [Planctomycetes bacterium GWA2_39_15]
MAKEEFISLRVSKELRDFLEAKAKKRGVKLSKLIEDELSDTYKTDNAQILNIISKRKQERPEYWNKFEKSPIAKKFETFISMIFTEFVNPISNDPEHQPVVLLGSIQNILKETINHFGSIPEEHRRLAADTLMSVGEVLIDGFVFIKSNDRETQEHIIDMKKNLVEKACYHFTALAFAKDSYIKIKTELEKVRDELIKELKEKSRD